MKKVTHPGDLYKRFQAKKKKAHSAEALTGLSKFVSEEKKEKKHKKNWIAGAIKHPGALHRQLGVKAGHKISAGKLATAAKKGGTIGKRARLAETLKSFHHKHSPVEKTEHHKMHAHHMKMHEHHKHMALHHKKLGDHKMHAHHMKMAAHHKKVAMHHHKMARM